MNPHSEGLEHSHPFARNTLRWVVGVSIAGMLGALIVGIVTGGGQAPGGIL